MITTVTLNASIDKAYILGTDMENGKVMRVAACNNSAGGKGLNVARTIHLCNESVKATGFIGGFNGLYLEALLKKDHIAYDFIHVKGETRSCINILDEKYGSTELLEPGFEISKEDESMFIEKFSEITKDSKIITISGSAPKGCSLDIYQRLIEQAKANDKYVILDTSGELLVNGLKACPTMVKPNKDEIEMLFQVSLVNSDEIIQYAKKIYDMGIPNVVVSLGEEGAVFICEEGVFKAVPPKIKVVNTVGCGDSMVGAFAVALKRNYNPIKAIRFAIAVATANALSPFTGMFNPTDYEEIFKLVNVKKIQEGGVICH